MGLSVLFGCLFCWLVGLLVCTLIEKRKVKSIGESMALHSSACPLHTELRLFAAECGVQVLVLWLVCRFVVCGLSCVFVCVFLVLPLPRWVLGASVGLALCELVGVVAIAPESCVSSVVPDHRRHRRRGPRSQLANLKRRYRKLGVTPTDAASGEAEAPTSVTHVDEQLSKLIIYSVNIRCILDKLVELQYQVDQITPQIVFVQETWLDASVENVPLHNYTCISRKDRSVSDNRGGVITFARDDLGDLVFLENSPVAERSWHILHTDAGDFLFANWYRPGSSDASHIEFLQVELDRHIPSCIGCVVAGDMNIHHQR